MKGSGDEILAIDDAIWLCLDGEIDDDCYIKLWVLGSGLLFINRL